MLQKLLQSFGCASSKTSNASNFVYDTAHRLLKANFDALTANDNSKLADEFYSLQDIDNVETSRAAEDCNNASKNRYVNVLPFDFNRVKLSNERGEEDYINASIIKSRENEQAPWCYIAAQGPLNSTTSDFWKMVEEHDSGAVVMLTKAVEKHSTKCADYFPTDKGETQQYDNYRITTLDQQDVSEDIVARVLSVENLTTSQVREVQHYQYHKWPDHGVPTTTKPIRQLAQTIASSPAAKKTIVVHCSAGIGRTGTFCSIDIILKRLRWLAQHRRAVPETVVQNAIDVRSVVLHLRQQRKGMVQTLDQYSFVYLVILQEVERHL